MDPYTVLVETVRPSEVVRVRAALTEARIPFRSGLLADQPPKVIFSVRRGDLDEARAVIDPHVLPEGWREDPPDRVDDDAGAAAPERARFPWKPVRLVGALTAVHVVFGFLVQGALPSGGALVEWGALRLVAMVEPWRFVTSMLLHADPSHAFWNGVSMMVFAVPLLHDLGTPRTAGVYFASGVGGGITAIAFARAGTSFIGSSGAVAGLFGAWIVLTLMKPLPEVLPWRARIRPIGIALLVIPSLLTPVSASGHPVSVASHVGGLLTGAVIGAAISGGLLKRARTVA